jgi:signal transduction histidine kinase
MRPEGDLKPMVGVGSLFGLVWVLIAFSTVRVLQSDGSVASRRVGLVISAVLALTLFAGVLGVREYDLTGQSLQIAAWTYFGAIAVALAVVVNTVTLEFVRPGFEIALYMVTTAVAAGAVLGFAVGLYDAHQRQNQRDLAAKRTEAQTLSNRLSVLNRVLRHDIRTQAQLLQGYTERMEAGELSPEAATERVQQTTDRLTTLSDEARELQHLLDEGGFETEPVDIVRTVTEAAETVQTAHPNLAVEYDLPDEQHVSASPMLTQAIEHVLHNVAEHCDESEPRAEVSVRTDHAANQSVQLTVADNGSGLDEMELIHNTGEPESALCHSKGLGLWLVTWIVEECDGDLEIQTPASAGTGTVVSVTLPAAST